VYVENLRVGLTNIQLFDNSKYFNNIENGVRVVKPEQMSKSKPGRTFLQVPSDLKDKMVVTLTWLGEERKLNLVADIFSRDSPDENEEKRPSCKVGYFNPACVGLKHSRPKDEKVAGETIEILSNAFSDSATGKVISDQTVFVYVSTSSLVDKDSKERLSKEDIALSNA